MTLPRVVRTPVGDVELRELSPAFLQALRTLPAALEDGGSEQVRRRLYPSPGGGEAARREWTRLVHPELRALFDSARALVESDLEALDAGPEPDGLRVPRAHVTAWLSALNRARLTLAARFGIGQDEMDRREWVAGDPASHALARIHVYGILQELILELDLDLGAG